MSSSAKGGSQKSKNYYGTVAGAICWGPIDWLTAVIHNGGYLWQGSLSITSDVTDLTGSIADPTLVGAGGYLKLYRGTPTQPADGALSGHSPYKDTALIVGKNLFFGQDSGTAPNLQVICGRIPRVPTAIVAAADNVADDGQVNPVAALAEFLLDERGAGVPQASFDAASWLAAAHWAYVNKDVAFCSPLITEQASVRDIVKRLLEPIGGFVRWSPSGQLSCKIYEWGVDPGGLTVVDARAWTRQPRFNLGDWVDIPTEYLVSFVDRAYEYQANSVLVPNARAAQIRQLDDQQRLDRPDVTRSTQAHRQATEVSRRQGTAPSSASIRVREPIIAGLLPGDKIRIDTDPEPGGTGLSQLCRITAIEQDRTDEATLKVVTDNLLPANVYQPTYTLPTPAVDTSPPMANFLAIPLPPVAFAFPPACAILATRPSAAVLGMDVYFSDAHANPFDGLGQQTGFAVRAQLAAGISSGATTLQLTELDGLSGFDALLASDTPGGNTTAAKNNTLLLVLATLDGNGRVALDVNGDPVMEFVSIVDRTFVSGATFSYTVLRGRLDTAAAAWTTSAAAWIVPLENIEPWRSDLMETITGAPAFFRLVSYTKGAVDTTATVPECSVNMMPTTSPMYMRGVIASGVNGTRTAILDLYKWSATTPTTFPSGTSTYTWATGQFTNPATLNGWSAVPPAPVNGQTLWVIRQVYADTLTTATTVVTWSASTPFAISAAGSHGQRIGFLEVYQWATSAPALPSGTSTYTWATGAFTAPSTPNGWSLTPGAAVPGQTLWACSVTISNNNTTATDSATWPGSSAYAVGSAGTNGTNGANGTNGTNGATVLGSSSGTGNASSTTWVDCASVTVTVAAGKTNVINCSGSVLNATAAIRSVYMRLVRDIGGTVTQLGSDFIYGNLPALTGSAPMAMTGADTPGGVTVTYKAQVRGTAAGVDVYGFADTFVVL